MPVRHVGNVEKRHPRLLGRAPALARVAAAARGDGVRPRIRAAARNRHDVIAREIADHEAPAAVRAHLAVAHEEHLVGEAGRMAMRARAAALDRQDRTRRDARAGAVLLPAAPELADLATDRPRDHLLRVVRDRFLELDPSLGQARHVDRKHQWIHVVNSGSRNAGTVHTSVISPKCKYARLRQNSLLARNSLGARRRRARGSARERSPNPHASVDISRPPR